jgi:hypothetical protein
MPNWCNNTVTISHEDPAMIERVRKAFNEGRLLDEFIPVPQELRDAVANFEVNEAMVEKYGYSNWYDFCVNEWGTKWDIGADGQEAIDNDNNTLSLNFDSAWAPPTTAYEKLMDMGFQILAYYYEPGMCFCGKWDNGDDDYYEYSGMTSEEVANTIPDDLDECFCISEQMAEWEEENREEEENEE